MKRCSFFTAILLLMAAFSTQAAEVITNTITLNVVADTMIKNSVDNTLDDDNFENNAQLIVGSSTGASGTDHRALIRFDTSSISVTAGATISVTATTLKVTNTGSSGQNDPTVYVYDYAHDFVASVATWLDPDGDGSAATGDPQPGGTIGAQLTLINNLVDNANVANIFPSSAAFCNVVETAIAGDKTVNLLVKRLTEETSGVNEYTRFRDNTFGSGFFQLVVTYELTLPSAGTLFLFE